MSPKRKERKGEMGIKVWFPNMFMRLINVKMQRKPPTATFHVPPAMTKTEIKQYLEKVVRARPELLSLYCVITGVVTCVNIRLIIRLSICFCKHALECSTIYSFTSLNQSIKWRGPGCAMKEEKESKWSVYTKYKWIVVIGKALELLSQFQCSVSVAD